MSVSEGSIISSETVCDSTEEPLLNGSNTHQPLSLFADSDIDFMMNREKKSKMRKIYRRKQREKRNQQDKKSRLHRTRHKITKKIRQKLIRLRMMNRGTNVPCFCMRDGEHQHVQISEKNHITVTPKAKYSPHLRSNNQHFNWKLFSDEIKATSEIFKHGGRKVAMARAIQKLDVESIRIMLDIFPELAKSKSYPYACNAALLVMQRCEEKSFCEPKHLPPLLDILNAIILSDLDYWSSVTDESQNTLLHSAIYFQSPQQVIELLLKHINKAVRFSRNTNGNTPFILAAEVGVAVDVIKVFLNSCSGDERRKIIRQVSSRGDEFIHVAMTRYGEKNTVVSEGVLNLVLAECGAELCKAKDRGGNTPLHLVASVDATSSAFEEILKYGPDQVTSRNLVGETPLHCILNSQKLPSEERFCNLLSCMKKEINGSISIYSKNIEGNTMLHDFLMNEDICFRHKSSHYIINGLLEFDKKSKYQKESLASAINKSGDTPLHLATKRGLPEELILMILRAYPRAVTRFNSEGYTPLHWALQDAYEEIQSLTGQSSRFSISAELETLNIEKHYSRLKLFESMLNAALQIAP